MPEERTGQQNKALHLFCLHLAKALNDSGLDMKKTLRPEIDIPWCMYSVKDHLFKPIQKAMTDKESTTELTTVEMTDVYEVLNRHMSEKFGITVAWPSIETQYEESRK